MVPYTKLLLLIGILISLLNYICNQKGTSQENNYKNDSNATKTNTNTNTSKTSKVLVVIDDWNLVYSHSLFWDQLKNSSYEIDFKMADDSNIKLSYYGEYLYDSIILCVPSLRENNLQKNSDIAKENILKFFDEGHNIMILADSNVNSYIRHLVTEFGVDFDDYDSSIKDSIYLHSNKDKLNPEVTNKNKNDLIITKNKVNIKQLFTPAKGFVLYEGIGLENDSHNQYLFSILNAEENNYSINSKNGVYFNFGDKIKLVSGYQGRNNKRVTISGSINMCSNEFYFLSSIDGTKPKESPNAVFCNEIIQWNFQKIGVLKYSNIKHQRKEDGLTLDKYRIKDELEYMVDIYEYDAKSDSWKPYLSDDLQIEYTMMDPYYRLQLKMVSPNQPTYYTTFRAPDKWGVFKFIIDYKRLGYSYLDISTKAPLRPYNHNEYERYLYVAYPYYISVFSVLLSFVVFSIIFIFSKNNK